MDAFVAAISLPTVWVFSHFLTLSYAFVPLFVRKLVTADLSGAWSTANSLLLLLSRRVTGIAAGLTWVAAEPLTGLLFPGFSPSQSQLTSRLLQILSGLVVTNGLIAYAQAVHHSHRRFLIPALAPVLGTAATVTMALVWPEPGMLTVGWAVLAGSLLTAAVQLVFPLRGFRFPRHWDPALQRFLWLSVPLVCGAAYFRLDPLVDRYLGSTLPTGEHLLISGTPRGW